MALGHRDHSAASATATTAFIYSPPTTSLRDGASTAWSDAFNRRQAAGSAIPVPQFGAPDSEYAVQADRSSRVDEQYRSDLLAITFPADAKSDADQLVRDVTSLIDAEQGLSSGFTNENIAAVRAALSKVDGDDRVLANDLGELITAPGDPGATPSTGLTG